VYGPQSLVELVDEVRAVISIDGARETINSKVTLQPMDEDGQVISGVSLSPETITVTIQIVQAGGYRDVAVRVETIGTPLAGYRVTNISVSPPTVTLFSSDPQLVLDIPGFVSTLPLDLTGASDDIEVRLALDLPEGITMVGDEQSVQVQVGIAAIETSITLTVPIQIIGLGSGLEAEVSPTTVDVFLTGPLTVLEALNHEDIIVFVSLTDLGPGSYLVAPQVDVLPEKVVLEAINPDTIEVTITGTVIPTVETTPIITPTLTFTPTPEP
jgi:YbbR domain-containing protein